MSGAVVGLRPWLPWPLGRWGWLTNPVRAERLAALRVGVAAVLLADVLTTYLPHGSDFFGPAGLGNPAQFLWTHDVRTGYWSLLHYVDPSWAVPLLWAWAAVAAGLLLGVGTRFCAAAAWVLSVSFSTANPSVENAGDWVRGIALFYLMLTPCGAVWSVDSLLWQRPRPVYAHPWALRLLFVQMALIYFCNGLHKVVGYDWTHGRSLYFVLADLTLARWSYAQVRIPYLLTRLLTWLVLGWECLFPLLVLWRRTRVPALWLGVAFHVGIFAALELGGFAPYMLCLYLPLLPWERLRRGPAV